MRSLVDRTGLRRLNAVYTVQHAERAINSDCLHSRHTQQAGTMKRSCLQLTRTIDGQQAASGGLEGVLPSFPSRGVIYAPIQFTCFNTLHCTATQKFFRTRFCRYWRCCAQHWTEATSLTALAQRCYQWRSDRRSKHAGLRTYAFYPRPSTPSYTICRALPPQTQLNTNHWSVTTLPEIHCGPWKLMPLLFLATTACIADRGYKQRA